MGKKLRRFGLLSRAALFTILVHVILIGLLLFSFNFSEKIERGSAKPIQAVAISEQELQAEINRQELKEEQEKRELEEIQRKQEEEKLKLEELEKQRKEEEAKLKKQEEEQKKKQEEERAELEKKKAEAENKRKEEERKKAEVEKKRQEEAQKKAEAEEKRQAEEKRKKEEAERKRKEDEKRKKEEAEKKRKEEEAKRRRAEELRKQVEAEQQAQTESNAVSALSALIDRIAAAVENNWRRPQTSRAGLTVTIRVKVARDGRVLSARIVRSSGDPYFDQSAETAVQKASPLPFPANPEYYEYINEFDFKFNPDG